MFPDTHISNKSDEFLLNVGYEVRTGLSTVCGGKKKEKMACFVHL
jgi:hypothetical protein